MEPSKLHWLNPFHPVLFSWLDILEQNLYGNVRHSSEKHRAIPTLDFLLWVQILFHLKGLHIHYF